MNVGAMIQKLSEHQVCNLQAGSGWLCLLSPPEHPTAASLEAAVGALVSSQGWALTSSEGSAGVWRQQLFLLA